jgi:hypothetical protein
MSRYGTSIIKKRYGSLVNKTLFNTFIGDVLRDINNISHKKGAEAK